MEMFRKVFKLKNADVVSVHQTTQYRKLRQDWTDDERDDEDDVVFLKKGIELKRQNGFDVDHMKLGNDTDIELKPCRSLKTSSDGIQVKQLTPRTRIVKKRQTFMVVTLILAVITILALVALSLHRQQDKMRKSWVQDFMDSEGTSNIVLYDVDEDGILDIIFSLATNFASFADLHLQGTSSNIDSTCTPEKNGINCLGRLVSIRGSNGELIWEVTTQHGMRSIRCHGVDFNKDHLPDCWASGYFGDLVAFSPKTGQVIWTSNSTQLKQNWFVIGAEALDDFNNDGVMDLVVLETSVDGSDSFNNVTEHQSKLLLVDGHSGKALGQPVEIKGRSKFPPIVHQFKDKSLYIIYGSGSQERPGSLYAINLRDFYILSMSSSLGSKPTTDSSAFKVPHFAGFENDGSFFKIVGGSAQGVIIPPLFFDADNDGEEDLLVASCDGNITLFQGTQNKVVWSISYSEHLVTREMVTGHFDDDESLDVLLYLNLKLHSNIGAPSSVVAILSGSTGAMLWSLNDSSIEFDAHDFIVHTTEKRRDMFMFWLKKEQFTEYDIDKRAKRHIRNSKLMLRKSHLPANKGGGSAFYDDLPYNQEISQFNGGRSYGRGDGEYQIPLDYGTELDQPFPMRRSKPYQSDYYNQPEEVPMFRSRYKSTWISTTEIMPKSSTSTLPSASDSCKSQVEWSFLVAVDRYSTGEPFVIAREEALFGLEKSRKGLLTHTCSSAMIKSLKSISGNVDGDLSIDLISAATLSKMPKVDGGKAIKRLRISKLNLQRKLSDVITKRLELLATPTSYLYTPSENYFLKASKYMTEKDLSRYTNFKLKHELHNKQ